MYSFVAVLLWLVFFFAIWYCKRPILWVPLSLGCLLIISEVGAFTIDHMWWFTSIGQAHYVRTTLATMAVGFGYHALDKWLYLRSAYTYKIVSFPFVVTSGLVIMPDLILKIVDEVVPRLTDNLTVQHVICIITEIVLAIVAWVKCQSAMARLFPPEPNLVISGDVTINGGEVTAQAPGAPESPYTHPNSGTGVTSY